MKEEAFTRLKREKLLPGALLRNDREARRRGLSEPRESSRPDSQQILLQARRRQANGLIILSVLILVCLPPVLYYRLYAPRFATFVLIPAFCLSLVLVTARQRGDKLVLWLRRFHVRRLSETYFDRLLQGACSGVGFPLTVQDSTFKNSPVMSWVKMQMLGTPLMLASFLVVYGTYRAFLFVFGLFGLTFPDPLASPTPGGGFWLIIGASLLVWGVATVFASRRLGYVRLKPANARDKTLRVIRDIEKQRGWHFETGVYVIHCDDSFWREIVELCLTRASVAVIDVTELSENVIWELETAFRLMVPESIVLACGVCEGISKELPIQVREQLLSRLPVSAITRAQTFFYPLRGSAQHVWGRPKALRSELQARLASGIAQGLSAGNGKEMV